MQPYFFGPERRLFGVYHPAAAAAKSTGVVLCQPIGHEYLRSHRAFRNLAHQLARQGFPVLRFDYSGSGDSAGEGSEARLGEWVADLSSAIDELKRAAGVSRVALAGLRLGAAIGAVTAARRRDVAAVILWDPVVRGAAYLQQLRQLHDAWVVGRGDGPAAAPPSAEGCLVGFPLRDETQGEIAAIDLATLDARHFPRVVVVASDPRYVDAGWAEGIRTLYGPKAFSVVPPAAGWENPEAIHAPILPQPILQAITAAVAAC